MSIYYVLFPQHQRLIQHSVSDLKGSPNVIDCSFTQELLRHNNSITTEIYTHVRIIYSKNKKSL